MHQLTPLQVLFVWSGLRPLCFPAVCVISSFGITAAAAAIAARTFSVGNYIAAAFFDIAYVCAATISAALLAIRSARSSVGVLVAPAVLLAALLALAREFHSV